MSLLFSNHQGHPLNQFSIKIFPSKAVIGQSAIYGPFALYVKDTSLIFVTAPSHGIPELIEVLKSRILAVGFNPSQVIHDKVIESYPINKTDPSVIVNIVDLYTRNFESRRDTQLKFITDSDAHASALSTQLSLLLRPKMSTSQILDLSQEPVPLDKASDKISPEPDASSDNSITWKAKAMLLAQQPHTDREREDHPDAEEKQLAEDGLPQANGDESQISGSDCAADGLEANPPVQRAEAEREPQVDMNAGTTLAEEDQLPQVPGDTSQPADSGRAASRLAERKVALSSAPVKLAKTNKSTSAYIWEMSTHKGLAKSAQKMPNTLEVHHTPPAPTVASSKPAIKLKAQMQSTEDPSDRPSTGTLATTTSRAKTKVTTKTTPNATKAADPFELPDSPSDEHSNNSLPVKRGQGKKNRKVAAATQSKADKTKKKGRQARKKTEQDSDSSSPDPINQSEYHPSQKVTTVNTSKKPATRAAAAAASNESNNRQSFLGPRPSAKTQSESVVVAPQSDQSKAKISQKKLHEVPEDHADSKVKAGTSQDNAMEISSDESEENVETPKDEAVDGEPQPAVVSGDGDFQNIDELEARFLDQETEVMLPLPMQVQSTLPQHAKPTTQKLRRQAQVPQSSAAEELLGSLIDENQAKKTSFIRFGRQGPENQGASALPKATTPGASSVSISTKTTSRPLQQMPSGMLLSSLRNASAKARPCLSQNAPAMGTRPKVLKNISNGQGHKRPNDDLTTMLAGSKRYRSSRRVRETTPTPFTGADDLPMLASSPPHEGTLAQAQDADTVPLAQGLKICSLRLDIAAVVPSATVVQQQQDRDSTPTPVGSRVTFSDPIVPEEVVPNRRGATNVAERNVQAPHNAGRAPRALKIQHSAQPHPKQSQSVFSSNTKLVPSDPRAPSRIMTGPAVMQEVDHVNDILRPPVENGDPFSSPTDGMSKKTTFLRELETRVREDQPMEREDEDGGPEQRDDPKSTPSSRSSGSSDPSTPPDDEFIDEEIADVGESPWANRLEPHARPVYRALRSGAQVSLSLQTLV